MSLHNMGKVIAFEVRRTLKRTSFWVMTLAVPVLILGVMTLVLASSNEAERVDRSRPTSVAFTYTDASGIVDPAIAAASGGTPAPDAASARQAVIAGRAELFVAYPADPTRTPIEVVGRDRGVMSPVSYAEIVTKVLVNSAKKRVPDALVAGVLTGQPSVSQQVYANGRLSPGWIGVLLPGSFLALFYMAIVMLGNQMLNITVEEKENRVTEMILTTINPTVLIVGKLIALVIVGVVQALVLVGPMLAVPALLTSLVPVTGLTESGASGAVLPTAAEVAAAVNVPAILIGLALFVGSFLLFTGLLVSIGAIMPTAKDAGSAFAAIVICLFLPFYALGLVMAEPHGVASSVLTYFPLTSPVTAMLRNATGTLDWWEAAIVLVVLYACAAALLALGIRLFRSGSISYHSKLNLRKVLGSGRAAA